MHDKIRQYYRDVDQSTYVEDGYLKTRSGAVAAIMGLFDDYSVHDRQGSPTFGGKQEIEGFFSKKRSLIGTHSIDEMKASEGIALGDHVRPKHLDGILGDCTTITVRRSFTGSLCKTTGEDRRIQQEHAADLTFTDYWITHQGKVLYRLSEIAPVRKVAPVSQEVLRY